jgi:hypothetical protein
MSCAYEYGGFDSSCGDRPQGWRGPPALETLHDSHHHIRPRSHPALNGLVGRKSSIFIRAQI